MVVAGMAGHSDIGKAHEIANEVRRVTKQLKEAQGLAGTYNNRERLFGMPVTNVSNIFRQVLAWWLVIIQNWTERSFNLIDVSFGFHDLVVAGMFKKKTPLDLTIKNSYVFYWQNHLSVSFILTLQLHIGVRVIMKFLAI